MAPWYRRVTWTRLVVALVLTITGLQIVHMLLLTRLQSRTIQLEYTTETTGQSRRDSDKSKDIDYHGEFVKLLSLIETASVLDNFGEHRIARMISMATGTPVGGDSDRDSVTLVTQASIGNLYHLIELSKRWSGPVSVSVFAPGHEAAVAVEAIVMLHSCVEHVRQNVTFHVVYPLSDPPNHLTISESVRHLQASCDHVQDTLNEAASRVRNYDTGIKYPNNLLRNVALDGARTEFVFVIDIDMVPSLNLQTLFTNFVRDNKRSVEDATTLDRTAFVVPVFEIMINYEMPKSKNALLDMYDSHKIRPFYQDTCTKCQAPTDYEAWIDVGEMPELRTVYEVDYRDPWEPFYIARKPVPRYDERFKQFGFNRISQVCELHIAGYRFAVLNTAFLVHKGFKARTSFHKTQTSEQERNRLLFRTFKQELKSKYPGTNRRC